MCENFRPASGPVTSARASVEAGVREPPSGAAVRTHYIRTRPRVGGSRVSGFIVFSPVSETQVRRVIALIYRQKSDSLSTGTVEPRGPGSN